MLNLIGIGAIGAPQRINRYRAGGVRPVAVLDAARGYVLDAPLTVTRAGAAYYQTAEGLLAQAAADVARYDHGSGRRAFLVEPSRQNIMNRGVPQIADWGVSGAVITNETGNYLGLLPGMSIASAGADWHRATRNLTLTAGTTYSIGLFVHSGTASRLYFSVKNAGGADALIRGDLGALLEINAVSGAFVLRRDYEVSPGLHYVTAQFTPTTTGTHTVGVGPATATSGAYITLCGMQIEAGALDTSFVPTYGASVTRPAETAAITLAAGTYDVEVQRAAGGIWTEGDSFCDPSTASSSLTRALRGGHRLAVATTAIGGSTMEQITARIEAAASARAADTLIVWDGAANGYTDMPALLAQLARIEAARGGAPWIYVPPIVANPIGTYGVDVATARAIHDAAVAAGYWVVDPWAALQAQASTPEDRASIAAGGLPPSIYADGTHLTEAAMAAVAPLVRAAIHPEVVTMTGVSHAGGGYWPAGVTGAIYQVAVYPDGAL